VARIDRTYTSDDVIRIYLNNLDDPEQVRVNNFFQGQFLRVVEESIDLFGVGLGLIPIVGELFEIVGTVRNLISLRNSINLNIEADATRQRLTL